MSSSSDSDSDDSSGSGSTSSSTPVRPVRKAPAPSGKSAAGSSVTSSTVSRLSKPGSKVAPKAAARRAASSSDDSSDDSSSGSSDSSDSSAPRKPVPKAKAAPKPASKPSTPTATPATRSAPASVPSAPEVTTPPPASGLSPLSEVSAPESAKGYPLDPAESLSPLRRTRRPLPSADHAAARLIAALYAVQAVSNDDLGACATLVSDRAARQLDALSFESMCALVATRHPRIFTLAGVPSPAEPAPAGAPVTPFATAAVTAHAALRGAAPHIETADLVRSIRVHHTCAMRKALLPALLELGDPRNIAAGSSAFPSEAPVPPITAPQELFKGPAMRAILAAGAPLAAQHAPQQGVAGAGADAQGNHAAHHSAGHAGHAGGALSDASSRPAAASAGATGQAVAGSVPPSSVPVQGLPVTSPSADGADGAGPLAPLAAGASEALPRRAQAGVVRRVLQYFAADDDLAGGLARPTSVAAAIHSRGDADDRGSAATINIVQGVRMLRACGYAEPEDDVRALWRSLSADSAGAMRPAVGVPPPKSIEGLVSTILGSSLLWLCGRYVTGIKQRDVAQCATLPPTSPEWVPRAAPWYQRVGAAVAAVGGSVYVFGGMVSPLTAEVLHRGKDQWEVLPCRLPVPVFDAAAVTSGEKVYIVGGGLDTADVEAPGASRRVFEFDTTTGLYTELPPMITARRGCCAAILDGDICVIGGTDGRAVLDSVEVYAVDDEEWYEIPELNDARKGATAVTFGGYVYVIGGRNALRAVNTVEVWDHDEAIWVTGPQLSTARADVRASCRASAVVFGGALVVVGGVDDAGEPLATAEVVGPQGRTLGIVPPVPRAGPCRLAVIT